MVLSPARAAASGGSVAGSTTRKLVVRKLRKLLGVLAMMAVAGVSIAYHAKPVVRDKATYCFDYVGLDGLLNLYA